MNIMINIKNPELTRRGVNVIYDELTTRIQRKEKYRGRGSYYRIGVFYETLQTVTTTSLRSFVCFSQNTVSIGGYVYYIPFVKSFLFVLDLTENGTRKRLGYTHEAGDRLPGDAHSGRSTSRTNC